MRTQTVPFPTTRPRGPRVDIPSAIRFGKHRTTLRFLRPEDADKLLQFFSTHTEDTIRSRYGYYFAHMTPERAAELVGVDQTRDAALGVFEMSPTGTKLIAIGRYCLSGRGDAAEAAFVVREDRRRLGIATTLLNALRKIAAERGLRRLTGQVQYDNPAMLAVFRRAGAHIAEIPGTGSMSVEMAIEG